MAIEDWMPALAERLRGIEGVEAVYFPDPNDSDAAMPATLAGAGFPCIVIMPQRGGEDERELHAPFRHHSMRIDEYARRRGMRASRPRAAATDNARKYAQIAPGANERRTCERRTQRGPTP